MCIVDCCGDIKSESITWLTKPWKHDCYKQLQLVLIQKGMAMPWNPISCTCGRVSV